MSSIPQICPCSGILVSSTVNSFSLDSLYSIQKPLKVKTGIRVSALILIVFLLCYLTLKLSADTEIPIWHLFLADKCQIFGTY